MFERKEAQTWKIHKINGSEVSGRHTKQEQAFPKEPGLEQLAWSSTMCKASFTSGVQVGVGANSWQMLNLEETLSNIDYRMAELPSVEDVITILQICRKKKNLAYAKRVHVHLCKYGLEAHTSVGNYIVPMFVECGSVSDAQQVFDRLINRNEYSWTSLMLGYIQCGKTQHALNLYEKMQEDKVPASVHTLMALLKACARLKYIERGRAIHARIAEKGLGRYLSVSNTLIDMYAKCGSLSEARKVFNKLPVQDVVSWTALLAGYAEHGPVLEALKCFERMQLEGVFPNAITFICVLKACGSMGTVCKGREIHAEVTQKFGRDLLVGNALVDMYAKCGSLIEAQEVFDDLSVQDVVSWSAMVKGYGMNHEGNLAIECFEDMQEQSVKPNSITFTSLLTACSHSNLVVKGQEYFQAMRAGYGLASTIEHFTCIVDVLARSGHLCEAEDFLEAMWCRPSKGTWTALLSACKTYGEAELGFRCFEQIIRRDSVFSASYVLMANIYASAGRWDDACGIQELRRDAGAKKNPAIALIEVDKKVYEFGVCSNQREEISAMLESLNSRMNGEAHLPNLDLIFRSDSDEKKEAAFCEHVEIIALAFGLLNSAKEQTLLVTKNSRMCNECHNASKIISRIERREIIVRDDCCIHHFKNSLCSCREMW